MSTEFQSSSSDTSVANAPRFQCRHIQTGGLRCGSRCLRNQDFCYYHHTTRRPKSVLEAAAQASRLTRHEARNAAFELPNPEDRSSIQHSIGEVLRRIAANTLDPRRAGLLLYGLQIASMNLHKETPKPLESWESPEPVDEIVDDPDFGPIAPRAEFATRPHEKSLAELLTEQWEKGDEREAEERAARTLAALKRQAAADNFTLPAILPDLSAEAVTQKRKAPRNHRIAAADPVPLLSRLSPSNPRYALLWPSSSELASHKLALRDSTRRHKWTGPQAASAATSKTGATTPAAEAMAAEATALARAVAVAASASSASSCCS